MQGQRLAFIDHRRQDYAKHVEPLGATDFMIGDYGDGSGGTGEWGEFLVVLHHLPAPTDRGRALYPQLRVFGDGVLALLEFIRLGGLTSLEDVYNGPAFSQRLLTLGLRDLSDRPLEDDPS
jgi:hypothetical protein